MDIYGYLHLYLKASHDWLFHRLMSPSQSDYSKCNVSCDVERILELLGVQEDSEFLTYVREYRLLSKILETRYSRIRLTYPENWKIGENTSMFLYVGIREIKPKVVVETGVANGHSTYFILNALKRNGQGILNSIDVKNNVGGLLSSDEKENWGLHIIEKPMNRRKSLTMISKNIGDIDIFIHDSVHFYYWQMFEYEIFLPKIRKGGFLLSDDVDSSYAFLDFSDRHGLVPHLLIDNSKILGIAPVL